MNSRDIQAALWNHLIFGYAKGGRVVPNFHMDKWFESDVLALSKSSFSWEIEVKVSAADFRKDAEKVTDRNYRGHGPKGFLPGMRKHDLLSVGCPTGPNRFSFAMPEALFNKIGMEAIPEFAGVMVVVHRWNRYAIKELRKPKLLHKNKADSHTVQRACDAMMYRYWKLAACLGDNARYPDDGGTLAALATAKAEQLREEGLHDVAAKLEETVHEIIRTYDDLNEPLQDTSGGSSVDSDCIVRA